MRYLFFILTIALVLFACNEDVEKTNTDQIKKILPHDKFDLPAIENLELNPSDLFFHHSRQQISFIDQVNSSLYIYDYATRKLINSHRFQIEGPEGLGKYNRLAHFLSDDGNVYIYNSYSNRILEYNHNFTKVATFLARFEDTQPNKAFPNPRNLKPLIVYDQTAYLMGISTGFEIHEDQTKVKLFTKVQLENNEVTFDLSRPAIYNQGQWGILMMYNNFFDFDSKNKRLICSFPIDHNIYFYDLETQLIKKQSLPIRIFPEEFKPFEKVDRGLQLSEKEKAKHYSYTHPSYYAILYDPYKKVYYRFGTPRLTEDEYQSNERLNLIVEIFDENFDSLGIFEFPKEYNLVYSCIFISPEGININTVPTEEGVITFYQFNPLL